MPRTCSVINCSNRSNRDKVKFYRFPSIRSAQRVVEEARVARRAQWVAALRRIDFDRVNINYTYICSEHFISGKPSDNPTNPDYVPSQNMGYDSQTTSDGRFKMMKFNRSRKKAQEKKALSLLHSTNSKMTKKRRLSNSSPIKMEIKEENVGGNDYLMAKGRLQGVLRQLTERSSDEETDSSDEGQTRRRRSDKKKKNQIVPTPYHHTYVMKLYDRSVDLARFAEDTPLYPLCRAWMDNQPKNPQRVIKRRVSSPEPENTSLNDSTVDVKKLPPPTKPFETRIPSPLPEQIVQDKDNINLNYDECPPVDKNVLIKDHLQRWVRVKKKWIETAAKNEERYARSFNILQSIYNKAQEHME